jgi:hypothetical protein
MRRPGAKANVAQSAPAVAYRDHVAMRRSRFAASRLYQAIGALPLLLYPTQKQAKP